MTRSMGLWLVGNAGLISVAGALIIFFSWAVTNTLGQRYSRLKQSVEAADNTFRLYTTLHELRNSINSVAMETVYAREAAEQGSRRSLDRQPSEVEELRRDFAHTRMSAHQIKELTDFSAQTLDFSSGLGTATTTSKRVKELYDDIYKMYEHVLDLERNVELHDATPGLNVSALREAIEAYDQHVRQVAIPQVPGFYEAIVETSNTRHDEGRRELSRSKRNAALAARIALVLYIAGSLLALGGQYLDKVHKKRVEGPQVRTISVPDSPTTPTR